MARPAQLRPDPEPVRSPSLPAANTQAPHVRSLPHPADAPTPHVSHPLPRARDRPEHGVAHDRPILPKP
jgi:hypothetical protein